MSEPGLTLINQPKPVGRYTLGTGNSFAIMLYRRPTWLARQMMRIFFDWHWRDEQ